MVIYFSLSTPPSPFPFGYYQWYNENYLKSRKNFKIYANCSVCARSIHFMKIKREKHEHA